MIVNKGNVTICPNEISFDGPLTITKDPKSLSSTDAIFDLLMTHFSKQLNSAVVTLPFTGCALGGPTVPSTTGSIIKTGDEK